MIGIYSPYCSLKSSFLRNLKICLLFSSVQLGTSSCAEKLNSGYSKKIVDHVNNVALSLYKLFAENQKGTLTKEYSTLREPQYNTIIADLETLKLQIISRPNINPAFQSAALKCFNTRFNIPCNSISYKELIEYPSKQSVEDLIKTIQQLKFSDSKANLNERKIRSFRTKISKNLNLIATYENILNQ